MVCRLDIIDIANTKEMGTDILIPDSIYEEIEKFIKIINSLNTDIKMRIYDKSIVSVGKPEILKLSSLMDKNKMRHKIKFDQKIVILYKADGCEFSIKEIDNNSVSMIVEGGELNDIYKTGNIKADDALKIIIGLETLNEAGVELL